MKLKNIRGNFPKWLIGDILNREKKISSYLSNYSDLEYLLNWEEMERCWDDFGQLILIFKYPNENRNWLYVSIGFVGCATDKHLLIYPGVNKFE